MRHQDKENGPQECGPFFIVFSDEEATTQWVAFFCYGRSIESALVRQPLIALYHA
jgi:hypothetical protein